MAGFLWELWGAPGSLTWSTALRRRTPCKGTQHLGLLQKPLGCWAVASRPLTETLCSVPTPLPLSPASCQLLPHCHSRLCVLEKTVMVNEGHFVEKLFALPHRLSQAKPCGTKKGPMAGGQSPHSNLLDQVGLSTVTLLSGALRPCLLSDP